MAGSFGSSEDEIFSGINVTPLVDVVLVLLIIFMITAPILYQSSIKVQLPKAKTGESAKTSPLNFTLNKEGALTWDKSPISWEALPKQLTSLGNRISEETAFISADAATPHGTVIKLMDALRQAGLSRFALNVESAR